MTNPAASSCWRRASAVAQSRACLACHRWSARTMISGGKSVGSAASAVAGRLRPSAASSRCSPVQQARAAAGSSWAGLVLLRVPKMDPSAPGTFRSSLSKAQASANGPGCCWMRSAYAGGVAVFSPAATARARSALASFCRAWRAASREWKVKFSGCR